MCVPVMGWSWAVFLADSYLVDLLQSTPSALDIFTPDRMIIEGAPPPLWDHEHPLLFFVYVGDFGIVMLIEEENDWTRLKELASLVRGHIVKTGLKVHKEECGSQVKALGMVVGNSPGRPPMVAPGPEKQWLAIEVLWRMGTRARPEPDWSRARLRLRL